MEKAIYVTQPAMPSLEDFVEYLTKIWDNKILTNNGPFHQEFEKELASYLGVKYISLFANGTLALITALQALKITGEVITTPYSFVATTHSLWWNSIKPVFVDIEATTYNLDPEKIEAAITPKTTAIMPVHVYGNPCNVSKLQVIADNYGLKIIYDAAHAFGVKLNGNSILNYGDLSIMSFHATKVFNTVEGGAIVCHDETTKKRIDFLKNFGYSDEVTVVAPGINAKMNEIQSAYGLLQLRNVNNCISEREKISNFYDQQLKGLKGIKCMGKLNNVDQTYSYYPIFVDYTVLGKTRDDLYMELKKHNINGRRYFYPLISQFPTYRGLNSANPDNLPIATKVSQQVICLPIYPGLEIDSILKIISVIRNFSHSN